MVARLFWNSALWFWSRECADGCTARRPDAHQRDGPAAIHPVLQREWTCRIYSPGPRCVPLRHRPHHPRRVLELPQWRPQGKTAQGLPRPPAEGAGDVRPVSMGIPGNEIGGHPRFPGTTERAAPSAPPTNWLKLVNQPQTEAEVAALRCCINRGRPFGDPDWVTDTAERLGLECTVRPRGRPKKQSWACHGYLYFRCSPDLSLQIWWLSPFTSSPGWPPGWPRGGVSPTRHVGSTPGAKPPSTSAPGHSPPREPRTAAIPRSTGGSVLVWVVPSSTWIKQ